MIYDTVQYLHSFAREWYAAEGNSIDDIILYPNMIILYNMSSKGMKKPIWSYDIDKYHYIKIINHFNSLYITELELYEFMKEKRGNNIENQKIKNHHDIIAFEKSKKLLEIGVFCIIIYCSVK